jgi:exosome complex component CSL4
MSEEIVNIGELIGVVEQYVPGSGTYEVNGKIYSQWFGNKRVNKQTLEVSVDPIKKKVLPVPAIGDVVIAEVIIGRKQTVTCSIFKLKDQFLFDTYNGILHVSNMSRDYIQSADTGFKPTDIIRARVIDKNFTEYELSTRDPEYGVIYAECSSCGTKLRRDGNQLVCDLCGYPNPRKIAKDYGHVAERISNIH